MERLRKLKNFYNRYERWLIPGALIFGFITDLLTFRLINFTTAIILLLFHLSFIGINISIINLYEAKKIAGKIFSYWRVLAPLFLQYSFGNLFSAFLIFYSHSGSFSASWPFIVVIIFLMIGNEVFRKYNTRPVIQISVYFFAIFSYTNLIFPHLLNDLSIRIFIGSGVVSLAVITFFVLILSSLYQISTKLKQISLSVVLIFSLMNFLYFSNLIPPIPLSLKNVGIHHNVERIDNNYVATSEDCGNFLRCFLYHERRHIETERQKLYLFSTVIAPAGMDFNATHEWQKFDEKERAWRTVADIPFSVVGGREVGFRWYSYNTVDPGYWRVNIKTERGQTIGRMNFYVVYKKGMPRTRFQIPNGY